VAEYRTHVRFEVGASDGDAGGRLLTALTRSAGDFGPVVSQNLADGTVEVTVSFDSPTGQPDVILGRSMGAIAPAVGDVFGYASPVVRAEVELVVAHAANVPSISLQPAHRLHGPGGFATPPSPSRSARRPGRRARQ
jgi:hypothetical protein